MSDVEKNNARVLERDEISAAWVAAQAALAERVRSAVGPGEHHCVVDLAVVDEDMALRWLKSNHATLRVAFFDGPGKRLSAGVGVAREVSTWDEVEAADFPILGAWRFHRARSPAPEWRAFGPGRFVVPRVYVHGDVDGAAKMGAIFSLPETEDAIDEPSSVDEVLRILDVAPSDAAYLRSTPSLKNYEAKVIPTFAGWSKSIDRALVAFEEEDTEKIVLARRTQIALPKALCPIDVLANFRANERDGFAFLIESDDDADGVVVDDKAAPPSRAAFLGVTPELLWRREGNTVGLEAVAGTRRRGATPREDEALAHELLHDDKERREHALVRTFIESKIEGTRGAALPEVRKFAHVQHLVTPLQAPAPSSVTLQDLAPTPAVCGTPRDRAFDLVAGLEPFDRGLYAGGVGALTRATETMAVGIRSILLRRHEVYLYAGAGIVAGSVAEHEWKEVQLKERGAKAALGLGTNSYSTSTATAVTTAAPKKRTNSGAVGGGAAA